MNAELRERFMSTIRKKNKPDGFTAKDVEVAAAGMVAAGIYKAVEAVVRKNQYLREYKENYERSGHAQEHERIEERARNTAERVASSTAYKIVEEYIDRLAREAWVKKAAEAVKPE